MCFFILKLFCILHYPPRCFLHGGGKDSNLGPKYLAAGSTVTPRHDIWSSDEADLLLLDDSPKICASEKLFAKGICCNFLGLPFFFVAIFWVPLVHLNLDTERHIVKSKFFWNLVFSTCR
jgi:hypothetical protein